jgi:hypothetical protein
VKGGVGGVAALVGEVLRRFLARPDLDDLLLSRMVFTEVGAQPALTVVKLQHGMAPSRDRRIILGGQRGKAK